MNAKALTLWKNISQDNILFILIDFQEKFFPLLKKSVIKLVKANILLLIKMFKELNIPMIGTEHYIKGLGHTEGDILNEWGDAPMTDKVTFNCCGDETFLQNLEKYSRPVVVTAGLETHVCVLQTVLDLLERNYQVVVLKDAVISSTKLKWENGIELMKEAGAQILNTETLLFYLLKRVDTKEFKYLVTLLKEHQASVS
ncbi:MAG: isochorismatase family protein [Candidatus Aminicenantes bacterium]|nr:isochorismatase family protein [Candidatus Aminicenantes bacterium]NIM79234.1 isochorismatase family protein [Candidatus Aminicenantes bacterium]NIN18512.1 isochorismatase family protein [Candidatus Aminicenantes bacterium]NIN42408.1 isochorismatase family protein [Candidatus Aminicenantes bacterium]NIN85175.1 isochorismatase family protein [Candidatus Aminicenantes bacterium]